MQESPKPKSWDDVFYLMRKEINADPELPNLSLEDIRQWCNTFWFMLKKCFADKSSPIKLTGFLTFYPRLKAIKRYEDRKRYYHEKIKNNEKEKEFQPVGSDGN